MYQLIGQQSERSLRHRQYFVPGRQASTTDEQAKEEQKLQTIMYSYLASSSHWNGMYASKSFLPASI